MAALVCSSASSSRPCARLAFGLGARDELETAMRLLQRRRRGVAPASSGSAQDSRAESRLGPQRCREDAGGAEENQEEAVRFHLVPRCGWNRCVAKLRLGVRNTLCWNSGALPPAERPCWLLATDDEIAVQMAQQQERLRALGYRLPACAAGVVLRLSNKAMLREHAARKGLLRHLPVHYNSPAEATYPCILKSATGAFGRDCYIVSSAEEALEVTQTGFGSTWILQELVRGNVEYSASLVVDRGKIVDSVAMAYVAAEDAFVWPKVRKIGKEIREVSADHLLVMEAFLEEYTGVCNFNYKVRASGSGNGDLSIFEINARVGGDLACDVPKMRARAMFETLDRLGADKEPEVPKRVPAATEAARAGAPVTAAAAAAAAAAAWEPPLVIEPRDGRHRRTLVYLHPFNIGLRDYISKAGLFSADGLRVVLPKARQLPITCMGGSRKLAWYDYLTDCDGAAEDRLDEATLAETRAYLFSILDQERALLRAGGAPGDGGACLMIGGCSQGCGAALDVALRYDVQLMGFVGVVGHPLSVTPLGKHLEMPLFFFNGAKDKVMRWSWVEPSLARLRAEGYKALHSSGPLPGLVHGVRRSFEAECVHKALREVAIALGETT